MMAGKMKFLTWKNSLNPTETHVTLFADWQIPHHPAAA
jgi:hypothetical protein